MGNKVLEPVRPHSTVLGASRCMVCVTAL